MARLPSYLRALRDLVARGVGTTSSVELAELSGVGPAQLRKDLSFLGSFGTRGVGYDVDSLAQYITEALGLVDEHRIAIVGIGNLGHALANYSGYEQRGFHVAALLDASPDVVGTRAAGLVVEHVDALEEVVEREKVSIVVLATPAAHAQAVADRVVAAGVRARSSTSRARAPGPGGRRRARRGRRQRAADPRVPLAGPRARGVAGALSGPGARTRGRRRGPRALHAALGAAPLPVGAGLARDVPGTTVRPA